MTTRPRILHVIDHSGNGGAQVVVANLITALRDRYDLAVAIIGESGQFSGTYQALSVPVYELGGGHGRWNPLPMLALMRLIRAEQFQLIHTHLFKSNLLGTLTARWTGCKSILHDHTGIYPQSLKRLAVNDIARLLYLQAHRWSIRLCDRVVVLTAEMRQSYADYYPASRNKLVVVPNGLDVRQYDHQYAARPDAAIRHQLGQPDETRLVIMVGRLEFEKDWWTFLRVAQIFQTAAAFRCAFVVVGVGSLDAALRRYVAEKKIDNTFFLGYRRDVPDLMRQSNVLLLTSRREPFGLVILEAMVAGLPVVATRSGGPESILTDGLTGLLADIGDARGLAEQVERLLIDQELSHRLANQAREVVMSYSIERIADDLALVYDEVLQI